MQMMVEKNLDIKAIEILMFLIMKLSALAKGLKLEELKKKEKENNNKVWFPHYFNIKRNQH